MRALLLLALVACSKPDVAAPRANTAQAPRAWPAVQRLVGTWMGMSDDPAGKPVEVTFRSIANNTALAETFGRPGRETMTLYHPDHGGLVATHYCGQGNASRLRVKTADDQRIVFEQSDVTDLDDDESTLVEMEIVFNPDGFDRVEVYRATDGTLERTRWQFMRLGSAP